MILAETSLSFLGLGLLPPTISWGVLLQGGAERPLDRRRRPGSSSPASRCASRCWRSTSSATACATPPTPMRRRAADMDRAPPPLRRHQGEPSVRPESPRSRREFLRRRRRRLRADERARPSAGRTLCVVGESGSRQERHRRSILQIVDRPGRVSPGSVLLHRHRTARSRGEEEHTIDLAGAAIRAPPRSAPSAAATSR